MTVQPRDPATKPYTVEERAEIVQESYALPPGHKLRDIATKYGIAKQDLYDWRAQARRKSSQEGSPALTAAKRTARRRWSTAQKSEILRHYDNRNPNESIKSFCRGQSISESMLYDWLKKREGGKLSSRGAAGARKKSALKPPKAAPPPSASNEASFECPDIGDPQTMAEQIATLRAAKSYLQAYNERLKAALLILIGDEQEDHG